MFQGNKQGLHYMNRNSLYITGEPARITLYEPRHEKKGVFGIQSRQRLALPPERPMNGERPERNRDRTGTGTTGTERRSVPFLAFLAFPVVPVHSSEKMERCLLKLSCYQTKRNLTFKTI